MSLNLPDYLPPSPVQSEALPEYVVEIGDDPMLSSNNLPPSYAVTTPRPAQPLTYTFTTFNSGKTLLMPPQASVNLSPAYNVAVTLDLSPFVPLSYITTIRRGGTETGEIVGSFVLSINQKRAFVTIGERTKRLASVMWKIHGSPRHWDWSFAGVNLRWDCRSTLDDGSPMCICYHAAISHQVATFVPPPLDVTPPGPAAVLTIFPDGWEWFDEILISALVVERQRGLEV